MRIVCAAIVLSGSFLACAGEAGESALIATRDSAGVHIVTFDSAAQSTAPQWRTEAAPDLLLANREEDTRYQFLSVVDALPVPDGIAVASTGSNDVRIYDDAGNHVRTIGGPGAGPGEFGSVAWLQRLRDDTIVVYDRGLRRMSVFDTAGRHVRDVNIHTVPRTFEGAAMQGPQPRGILADGTILVALYQAPARLDGHSRPAVFLHAYDPAGTPGDRLATAAGDDIYILPLGNGRAAVARPPFFRITMFEPASNGFWVADNDTWELRRYDLNGTLTTIVRRSQAGAAITPQILETYLEAQLAGHPEGPRRESARADALAMAVHASMPAYAFALVADDGRIWVQDHAVPQESGEMWSVISAGGRLEARVRIPAALRVLWLGTSSVIGVLKDDLDRESVARYRLESIH